MSIKTFLVRLRGIRPLMFDRYAGDNNTQLPLHEKMYLASDGRLIFPAINLYSRRTIIEIKYVRFMSRCYQGERYSAEVIPQPACEIAPYSIFRCQEADPHNLSIHSTTGVIRG